MQRCENNKPGVPYLDTRVDSTVNGLGLQGKPLGPAYERMIQRARANEIAFQAEAAARRAMPLCHVDQLGPGGPGVCGRSEFYPVTYSNGSHC